VEYVIIDKNSSYLGGNGYAGPACSQVGVFPGHIYLRKTDADYNAKLLSAVSSAGFEVIVYQPPE
jgi:hypothetical protein